MSEYPNEKLSLHTRTQEVVRSAEATPRTDAFYRKHSICEYETQADSGDCDAWLDFASQLERELAAVTAEAHEHYQPQIDEGIKENNNLRKELAAVTAERDEMKRNIDYWEIGTYQERAEQAEAERDALRADAERYPYLVNAWLEIHEPLVEMLSEAQNKAQINAVIDAARGVK